MYALNPAWHHHPQSCLRNLSRYCLLIAPKDMTRFVGTCITNAAAKASTARPQNNIVLTEILPPSHSLDLHPRALPTKVQNAASRQFVPFRQKERPRTITPYSVAQKRVTSEASKSGLRKGHSRIDSIKDSHGPRNSCKCTLCCPC